MLTDLVNLKSSGVNKFPTPPSLNSSFENSRPKRH